MQAAGRTAAQLQTLARLAVVGGIGVYGVSNSIFNVEGGHRAIIFNRLVGIKDTVRFAGLALVPRPLRPCWSCFAHACRQVYAEGTHFMVPWFERPVIYDVRAQPNIVQSTSGSRDLQMVRFRAAAAGARRPSGCRGTLWVVRAGSSPV